LPQSNILKNKNAVNPQHYQEPDIQDIRGDLPGLAQQADTTNACAVVFSDVRFITATARIRKPVKSVAPRSERAVFPGRQRTGNEFRTFREGHSQHTIISFIDCTAGLKA
jgi:quinolinate synthase